MPPFTFRQLEFAAALLDHATLASASRQLHISESALSHAISELEAAVGDQLCVRRKAKGISLTPTGRYFAEQAKRLLREAHALAGNLGEARGEYSGPVSLGCFVGLASNILPALLEKIMVVHPKIEVSITVGDHADLLPALDEGLLDAAIVYDIDLPPGLARREIYETQGMAIFAASDSMAQREDVDLAELADRPLIMLDTAPSKEYTNLAFASRGLKPRIKAVVPQIDLVRALVARGLGYSLLMARPNQIPVSSEGLELVTRHLRPRAGETSVVMAWQAAAPLSRRAGAVIDCAMDVVGAMDHG